LEAIGCQELLDRKVRKLYNFRTFVVGDGDKSGTRGEHGLLWTFWSPALHEISNSRAEVNCEYLCYLLDTKWSMSRNHALEEPRGMLGLLFGDALQNPLICAIQSDR
jgi:hypothetical protein